MLKRQQRERTVKRFLETSRRAPPVAREPSLGEHKPGRIKPGRIKRAALSLQNPSLWYTPCILNMSGAGFAPNSQIWLLGTTPFDTTPFICL